MSLYTQIRDGRPEWGNQPEHQYRPTLSQKTIFSMEPAGMFGSVYEDPRGPMNLRQRMIALAIASVLIISMIFVTVHSTFSTTKETIPEIAALSTPVKRGIPKAKDLYDLSDSEILDKISEKNTIYTISDDETGIEAVRVGGDLTSEQTALDYVTGLSKLGTKDLAVLLQNAWWLTTERGSSYRLKIKYADFTSVYLDKAIADSMERQGIVEGVNATVLASGVDTSNNTYKYGTVKNDKDTLFWRVAAIPLKTVYIDEELPNDSIYVGVTICDSSFMSTTETNGSNQ